MIKNWLINYIPIRKSIYGFKDEIVSLLKTNTPKQTLYGKEQRKELEKKKILIKLNLT